MNIFVKLALPLLLVAGIVTVSASSLTPKSVVFDSTNVVSLNSIINSQSVVDTINALEANKGKVTYLFIDSPGGSVVDGLVLVNYLKHTTKPIHCIAKYAASMAHAILQACPVRLATEDNILMQHKLSGGAAGSPTEIEGQLKIMKGLEATLTDLETKRIGISKEEFTKRTFEPWFTYGQESKKENVVDAIVDVSCASELYKIHTDKEIHVFFFTIKVRYSGCPLLPAVEVPQEVGSGGK